MVITEKQSALDRNKATFITHLDLICIRLKITTAT